VITVPGDYATIQAAIDTCTDGDEIIVSPGTYYENINFNGKNIILRSTDPTSPTVVANTIIDGRSTDSVVKFLGTESPSCVLTGFTITNGYSANGGGINGNSTKATIQHCNIITNTTYGLDSDGHGGGLFDCDGIIQNNTISSNSARYGKGGGLFNCDGTIQNNTISSNWANADGGGLYNCGGTVQNNTISGNSSRHQSGGGLYGCGGTILNNTITGNSASLWGGGLCKCNGTVQNNTISGNLGSNGAGLSNCSGTIRNNIISGNLGSKGGGLYDCGGTILNNTIAGNSAQYGGGLYICSGTIQNNTIAGNSASFAGGLGVCRGSIINCIIWENPTTFGSQFDVCSTPSYSCIRGWTGGGRGNISSDPKFIDPHNGNYHLAHDSPCIDTGNTYYILGEYLVDIDGECRVAGSSIDMGSDEYGSSRDSDRDLLADVDEANRGSSPDDRDTDGDGLIDGAEVLRGTSPVVYNSPSGISIPEDYPSVQQAIFLAFPSEVITVSPGIYHENLRFLGKNIVLKSTNPADEGIVSTTIIDGNGLFSSIFFEGTENESCSIKGMTIRNGAALHGGGISGNGALALIERNRILNNSATYDGGGLHQCHGTIQSNSILSNAVTGSNGSGGGLYECNGIIANNTISGNSAFLRGGGLYGCNGTIVNNTISGNAAVYGGGLCRCQCTIQSNMISTNLSVGDGGGLYGCHGTIQNNIIVGNSCGAAGGGLFRCGSFGEAIIQHNTITGNSASSSGGGLYWCNAMIINNTISDNTAARGGGIYMCKDLIINCIIWGNSATTLTLGQIADSSTPLYSCIQDWSSKGRGNISDNPQFVNPTKANYHLQPDSPCINAGNTYYLFGEYIADIDGECRVIGGLLDMGSDEYGSSLDCDGDLLADVEEAYQNTDPNNADTDGDGVVDGAETLRGTDPALYNTPSGISVGAEYASIQQGIFLAFPGEEIIVSPGTYNENIHFLGKNIALRSTGPLNDDIVSNTIIDGGGSYSVIFLTGKEDATSAIKGFTIRNGSSYRGGGIRGNKALAAIENNKILDNSAGDGGGLYECHGTIRNNIISGNSATWRYGGGLSWCGGIIENNIILRNSVIGHHTGGGGLYSCNGIIQNNIIYGNSVIGEYYARGGGLYSCNGTLQNNTIVGNSAIGMMERSGSGLSKCNGIIRNCIISQNTGTAQIGSCSNPSYSCITDWWNPGTGNIFDDPLLADPANGNFHLLPSSPCIDAGGYVEGLTEDFEGDARPMDGTSEPRGDGSDFDIGADEFPGTFKVQEYNFELTDEGWTSVTLSAYFTPPECYYLPGYIILSAQDNTNTYGFWTSEPDAVPVIADCLYRANWTVVTDVTDPLAVPHMQLRVNSQNFQQADILVVSSAGDGSYAPTPDGRTYEMYFVPPESALGKPEDQDDLILSFDILNFDPSDTAYGSVMLDRVVVDAIPLETLDAPTLLKTWGFDTDAEGWQFGSAPILFTPPTSNIASGALWLTALNNTNTFGFWSGPSEEVQVEEGKLYRLRFTVSTDVTIQEEVPQLRLRASSEDFQSGIVKVINSATGAEMSPTPAGRTYDLYFYPPQSLVGTDADSILTAFDMLNFDPADASNGSLILDSVTVESLNIP